MVVGLLGNKSSDSNRFTLVTPKSENDVRLQATLGNQNLIGLPVGVVRAAYNFWLLVAPLVAISLIYIVLRKNKKKKLKKNNSHTKLDEVK